MNPSIASEPAEPTTRPQDDVIEKAAGAICDAYEAYAPVPGVLRSEASNIARALAGLGLLADPAQTTELEQVVAQSVHLLREAGVNRGNGLPARVSTLIGERDALEEILSKERRRVDAALAIRDQPNNVAPRHDFSAGWKHAIDAVRAALVGDQPKAEEPKARCCIGPFADGTHAPGCLDACQDCGGDEAGPHRCQCSEADPEKLCGATNAANPDLVRTCTHPPHPDDQLHMDHWTTWWGDDRQRVEEADDAAGDLP